MEQTKIKRRSRQSFHNSFNNVLQLRSIIFDSGLELEDQEFDDAYSETLNKVGSVSVDSLNRTLIAIQARNLSYKQ